jgi:citrate lyase subunit beta/citryl-CoA lyase
VAPAGPILTSLYVPGDRPDRFAKALASDADTVIIDLEDSVAPNRKELARDAVRRFLDVPVRKPVQVRINALGSPWVDADLAAIASSTGLTGIRLPKVGSPDDVASVTRKLPAGRSLGIHILIESARGLEAAFQIATADPLIASIALGEADLRSELRLTDDRGLAWARGRIVVAARAAGLPAPAMSVYTDLDDDAGLAASCREGRDLGFLGRAAIHPRQLAIIVDAFLPSAAEATEATELLAALAGATDAGRGMVVLPDGRFIDLAMADGARHVVELAARRRAAG